MISYYCIVNTPGIPCREIAAVQAVDDASARRETKGLAKAWPGYETVALYQGERLVWVLANPLQGFEAAPLDGLDQAA